MQARSWLAGPLAFLAASIGDIFPSTLNQGRWRRARLGLLNGGCAAVAEARRNPLLRLQSIVLLIGLAAVADLAMVQSPPAPRPAPPTRDPHTPGYVTARELPDGSNPPANADGNFIIGPTYHPAPELSAHGAVPQGTVSEFTMDSADSRIY